MSSALNKGESRAEGELLIAFVNTRDFEDGADEIGTPEELERWIPRADAGVGTPAVSPAEHRRILSLRESLRTLFQANNGGEPSADGIDDLRRAAAKASFSSSLGPDGSVRIEPTGRGAAILEARLLLAVERVQAAGDWARLKACPPEDCQFAFFDTSRNRSRTWCSMEVCGNRDKTRRYRDRRAAD